MRVDALILILLALSGCAAPAQIREHTDATDATQHDNATAVNSTKTDCNVSAANASSAACPAPTPRPSSGEAGQTTPQNATQGADGERGRNGTNGTNGTDCSGTTVNVGGQNC